MLTKKGFKIIGEFFCLGFDTALTKEGINKGKPDKQDLENAERFIKSILTKWLYFDDSYIYPKVWNFEPIFKRNNKSYRTS